MGLIALVCAALACNTLTPAATPTAPPPVSDGGGTTSHLVATADPGEYFHVVQWLDADTLLLQSVGAVPGVYRAAADGSGAVRLGDGTLLGVIDNLAGQPLGEQTIINSRAGPGKRLAPLTL